MRIATVFSGIGAVEYALKRMQIKTDIVFACDIDKYVKESYQNNYNLPDERWYNDIQDIKGEKYRGEIELFVGGSPCQSFSSAGKQRGLEDSRGQLVFEFTRLLGEIKPEIFIFENVRAIEKNNKGITWKLISEEFDKLGYHWDYKLLNAQHFGIPQHRERVYVVGFIDENRFNKFEFSDTVTNPMITTHDLLEDTLYDSNWKLDYNDGLMNMSKYFGLKGDFLISKPRSYHQDKEYFNTFFLSKKIKKYILAGGTKGFYCKPRWDLQIAKPLLATMHKMHRAGIDNYFKYDKDKNKIDPSISNHYVTEDELYRKLTPRESLRMMGFDDRFKIVVSNTQIYRQAGNSIVVDVLIDILERIY